MYNSNGLLTSSNWAQVIDKSIEAPIQVIRKAKNKQQFTCEEDLNEAWETGEIIYAFEQSKSSQPNL